LREPPPEPGSWGDPAAAINADLLDEQAEKFFGLFGVFVGEDVIDFLGEAGEGGRVRRRVRPCGEPAREIGLLLAEGLEALTVATDAFLADRR
jgi:hypothetical protein